jgi:hypothetical protein
VLWCNGGDDQAENIGQAIGRDEHRSGLSSSSTAVNGDQGAVFSGPRTIHIDEPPHGHSLARENPNSRLQGDIPRHAVPSARAAQQGAYLCRGREQDSEQYRLSVQGDGIEHGTCRLYMEDDHLRLCWRQRSAQAVSRGWAT